jgi:hypothetical protein
VERAGGFRARQATTWKGREDPFRLRVKEAAETRRYVRVGHETSRVEIFS